ncbi:MAG: nickel-dependent lactate racemase [Chloroflexota bacterium]
MRVRIDYGSTGIEIDLPEELTTVVEPRHQAASPVPREALFAALRVPVAGPPLRRIAKAGQSVAISVCDITRPQPREAMLEAILDELDGIIHPADVTIIVATGTHRASTESELLQMLGQRVLADCRVVDHDARDADGLTDMGSVGDVPVLLNSEWAAADLRITTGFVEPHFFAGFSGGPKMVAPGLAGLATTLVLHDARRIADPRATWAICEGNPVHDDVRAIAAATGVDFALDVLLNGDKAITRAFGGSILAMHAAAREAAKGEAMRSVEGRFDIVVTSNSGYPLDQNLYQAIKGISAAAQIVRDGGTIICAAECRDGLPDHGNYAEILASADSPEALLEVIAASPVTLPDQWQVQVQARVQLRANVLVHADGLTDEQLRAAHLEPCADISATVARLVEERPDVRIAVLPQGPQTIAYVA